MTGERARHGRRPIGPWRLFGQMAKDPCNVCPRAERAMAYMGSCCEVIRAPVPTTTPLFLVANMVVMVNGFDDGRSVGVSAVLASGAYPPRRRSCTIDSK